MTIHTAALEGQLGLVKQMVEQDKKAITAKDEDERQALHWGVSGKKLDVVEYLLQQGAPVNSRDEDDWTPLHIAGILEGVRTVL
ncbi:MAG: ankyrin repeat protein [Benniella sp.]|nr:MAG: ankyrin repeat protein [Benniella sp.]